MLSILLLTIFLLDSLADSAHGDKSFVVDGALSAAFRRLNGKSHGLATASEPFIQQFGNNRVHFELVLSGGKLQVEEMTRHGQIEYTENDPDAIFSFYGRLKARIDSDYTLYGSETMVSAGNAVVNWDVSFNTSLITRSCNFVLLSQPIFESQSFHIDLYSKDKKMNVSYSDDPFNSVTGVFQQKLSVLIEHSIGEVPICDAIEC